MHGSARKVFIFFFYVALALIFYLHFKYAKFKTTDLSFSSDQMEIRTAGVIVLLHWILTTSRLAEDAVDIDV